MSKLLEGKKGIIFGALDEKSIAWQVAKRANEQGAKIVLSNAPVAFRFGGIQKLAESIDAPAIPADATSMEDLKNLICQSTEHFNGKFDFVLHSIGMSMNVRKKKPYTNLNHDWMLKTFDISAVSFHKVMQTLLQNDAINDWGSVVALSYLAAQRTFPEYNEMAESKALLESFARSFGYHLGVAKKVRVNTVSQSPTYTTAGSGVEGFDDFYNIAHQTAPLGNASAEDCANLCSFLFSDMSRMITMQNIFHDGGYSSMGINSMG